MGLVSGRKEGRKWTWKTKMSQRKRIESGPLVEACAGSLMYSTGGHCSVTNAGGLMNRW